MFLGWKNQCCENDYATQSNLQIECNPNKITNGIFHRNRTENVTVCMKIHEIQKPKQSSKRKMELEESASLTSDDAKKLQKSRQYSTSLITSWQIDGETVETVADFILGGLQDHCRC